MSKIDGVEFDESDSFDYDKKSRPIRFVNSTNSTNPNNTLLNRNQANINNSNEKGIAGWLMKKGWADSPNAAKKILFGIIIINVIITIIASSL